MNDRELDEYLATHLMNKAVWYHELIESRGYQWSPTRDLLAAFEVVEKLRERGISFIAGTRGDEWVVGFVTGTINERCIHPSLPKAICEAAKMIIEKS